MTISFAYFSIQQPSRREPTAPPALTRTEAAAEELAHITSKRRPRFVDHTACPTCSHPRIGLEYQGELMSGVKLHTLGAHSYGFASVTMGRPRCLGAGTRMEFRDGDWRLL